MNRKGAVPELEKLKVWVRSGGRCAFCNAYLLESDLTLRPVPLGEVAHNIAASDGGPRANPNATAAERNSADNLVLLCGLHHPDADKTAQLDIFTVDQLRAIKVAHERRIREATEAASRSPTALLRMQGHIRGAPVEVGVDAAVEAVIRSSNRFPELTLSFDRKGVEIDLRQLPGEIEAGDPYYQAAVARIDEVLVQRLRPAVDKGAVKHISVFALARFPLLVYLGSRLDDALLVEVLQRHRATQSWVWPELDDGDSCFVARRAEQADVDHAALAKEAALVINASGTIHLAELPEATRTMPTYVIELEDGTPHPDSVRSPTVRDSFERAVREMLGQLEERHKSVRRLHVFAAAPVSVGVTLGRAVGWGIHPTLVVYDRLDDGTYRPALEITQP